MSALRTVWASASTQVARYRPEGIQFPTYKGHCAKVSVINGATTQMLSSMLVHPAPSSAAHKYMRLASYSFLIESHHRSQKVLFDLAFMKNLFTRMPPALKAMLTGGTDVVDPVMKIEQLCDVPDTLQAHGQDLSGINNIIWSHAHIDHVGDPSVFPYSTDLVVGPGFKSAYMPGYPVNPDATVLDSAFQGRSVKEVEFGKYGSDVTNIGGFRAVDFWRDDTWVFMGADCCHSVAQLRPSQFRALPQSLPVNMMSPPGSPQSSPCPCAQLLHLLHTSGKNDKEIYELAPFLQEDAGKAQQTLEKLKAFDGRDDVMVVLAHDASFLDVLDFFPRSINDWMAKGWDEQARWLFLRDIALSRMRCEVLRGTL
ncbi:hypothetical protein LA080_005178 [Diaporthe eres]|nr:hypothetical protein LA080_005178 [Diaporthe eres]